MTVRIHRARRRLARSARRANIWLKRLDERFGAIFNVVAGTVLVMVALACLVLGLQLRGQTALGVQACEHSRNFGPYIARDYERRSVLPDALQKEYERSIPRRC